MAVITRITTAVLADAAAPRDTEQEDAAVRDALLCNTTDWSFTVHKP